MKFVSQLFDKFWKLSFFTDLMPKICYLKRHLNYEFKRCFSIIKRTKNWEFNGHENSQHESIFNDGILII
jgi:hypothetical protein